MRALATNLPPENIVAEPAKRDTAAAIALGAPVVTAEAFGWSSDAMEAQAFAYLAVRSQRALPEDVKFFPEYLRAAGYFTTNNAKTDYNSSINPKQTWDESGKDAHWRKRPDSAQPFFSVFNHEVTHESCLFPVAFRKPGQQPR